MTKNACFLQPIQTKTLELENHQYTQKIWNKPNKFALRAQQLLPFPWAGHQSVDLSKELKYRDNKQKKKQYDHP